MVNRDVLWSRINAVERHLARVRQKRGVSLHAFLEDLDRQESILYNLQMAIQACIDMAAHIVSEEEMGIAGSTNELFYFLEANGVISPGLSEKMVRAVGFRNLIVHEYGRVDLEIVHRVAVENVRDLEEFARVLVNRYG